MPGSGCQMGDVISTSRIDFLNQSSKTGWFYKQFWNQRFWTGMLLLWISTCTSPHTKTYMQRQADFILARRVRVLNLQTKLSIASLSFSIDILLIVVVAPLLSLLLNITKSLSLQWCSGVQWKPFLVVDSRRWFSSFILVVHSHRAFGSIFCFLVVGVVFPSHGQ